MPRSLAVFDKFDPSGTQSLANAVSRFSERNIVLPKFSELRDPSTLDSELLDDLNTCLLYTSDAADE